MNLLRDVMMGVSVELGRTRMTVRELLALTPGAIVELDQAAGAPVDLLVNGTLIARGEVVVIDEEFAAAHLRDRLVGPGWPARRMTCAARAPGGRHGPGMVDGSLAGTLLRLVVSLAVVLAAAGVLARYLNGRQGGTGRGVARRAAGAGRAGRGASRVTASAAAPASPSARRWAAAVVGVTETSVSVPRELEEEPEPVDPPQDVPAGPVAGPAARSGRWWSCCASGPPVVADLRRAALAALLLAPLFVLAARRAVRSGRAGDDAGGGGRARGRAVAGDGAEPDADHDLHRPSARPSNGSGNVSVNLDPGVGKPSQTVSIILLLTVLSVAPALLLMCTAFTKVIVVLSLTRNALGHADDPAEPGAGRARAVPQPVHHGAGPVADERRRRAALPQGRRSASPQAFDAGVKPLRTFMLEQTRKDELAHDDPAEQDRAPGQAPRTCR